MYTVKAQIVWSVLCNMLYTELVEADPAVLNNDSHSYSYYDTSITYQPILLSIYLAAS